MDTAYLGPLALHVIEIRDDIGRDLVELRYPERDGAEQADVGRAPWKGTLRIGFIGEFWRTSFDRLKQMAETEGAYTFTHPVTSARYNVRIVRFQPTHSPQILNGAVATLQLVEDNSVTAGLLIAQAGVGGAAASFDEAASSASSALEALP